MNTRWAVKILQFGLAGVIALAALEASAELKGDPTTTTLVSSANPAPLGDQSTVAAIAMPVPPAAGTPTSSTALTQMVSRISTALSLASTKNPSPAGELISFNAIVAATSGGTPTGTVQFQVDGVPLDSPVALVNGNAWSRATGALRQGTHIVAATYGGDSTFNPSTDTGSQIIYPTSATCAAANNGPLYTGATLQLSGKTTDTSASVFYSWTGPNGFKSSSQNPTITNVTATNAGTYFLTSGTSLSTNCVAQTVVTVSAALSAAINGANTVCPRSTNSFSGPASMESYAWSVEGAATIIGSTSNQTVSIAAAPGCNTNFVVSLASVAGASSSMFTQAVTVVDTTAPEIVSTAADATYSCADFIPAANDALMIANDACGGTATISHAADVIVSNACANRITVTRVYTATDACGNSASRTQTFTINDKEGPVFNKVPADITVNNGAVPPAPTLVAVDNCLGEPEVIYNETKSAGAAESDYVLTRTWTATDACGNSTVAVQKITVNAIGAQASR